MKTPLPFADSEHLVLDVDENLLGSSAALFSPCRRYRYRLRRRWAEGEDYALFLMLNPSTADAFANDPTVERCQRRAVAMGYPAFEVANIFALRSTDPAALYGEADPAGPDNDRQIFNAARGARIVICGWGEHGKHLGRGKAVFDMLVSAGVALHALKINASGHPQHPLYVGYSHQPRAYTAMRPWD